MKFNAVAAAVGAALLAGNVYADAEEAQKVIQDDAAEASTVAPPIATFTVSSPLLHRINHIHNPTVLTKLLIPLGP